MTDGCRISDHPLTVSDDEPENDQDTGYEDGIRHLDGVERIAVEEKVR